MDRERVINQIQKINCMGRNNITELANLQNDELLERLNELINMKIERLVTISTRVVYHKYAEVQVEIPKDLPKDKVANWLWGNEHLYTDDLNQRLDESQYHFGFGLGNGMDEKDEEVETRYDLEGEKYGGHL